MIKQVLVQLPNLQEFRSTNPKYFKNIFEGIIVRNRQVKNGSNLSASLQMKVKYLIYLIEKQKNESWSKIIAEMNVELEDR